MRSSQHVADKTTPIQWPEACMKIMQDPAWSGLSRQAEDAKYYHFHAWRTLWFVPGVQVDLIQLELPGGLAGAGDLCPLDHGHVPGNPSPHLGWKSKCSIALVPHSAGQFTSSMPTLASCTMMMIVFAHTLLAYQYPGKISIAAWTSEVPLGDVSPLQSGCHFGIPRQDHSR